MNMYQPEMPNPGHPLLPALKIRKRVNEMSEGRILQRGQILSWTLPEKQALFREMGITVVVNFWPKIDSDLSDSGLSWYWHIPVARSANMFALPVLAAADAVAALLVRDPTQRVMILCEAGKTRSVCFCVLVVARLHEISMVDALAQVEAAVPGHSLKSFMIDHFNSVRPVSKPSQEGTGVATT